MQGGHLSPGAAFWGHQIESECYVIISKCQMLADTDNYDLQYVECQGLPCGEIARLAVTYLRE